MLEVEAELEGTYLRLRRLLFASFLNP